MWLRTTLGKMQRERMSYCSIFKVGSGGWEGGLHEASAFSPSIEVKQL
jgi:hypothetical protein